MCFPVTIPSFSIPSGTLSVIIDERITQFASDYRNFFFNGATSVGEGRGITFNGAIGVAASSSAATVTYTILQSGVYILQGYVGGFISVANQSVFLQILAAGTTAAVVTQGTTDSGEKCAATASAIRFLTAGSQVSLVWSGQGGLGWTLQSLGFSVCRISA